VKSAAADTPWLVTGATGHIGNVLVRRLLQRGDRVRVLVPRGESRLPLSGLELQVLEGDVLDPRRVHAALSGARGVFHLAGMISILPGPDAHLRRVNVEGTANVLEAARALNVPKLIYTSSIHAIRRVEDVVIDERLPYDPQNPYGEYDRSKAQATLLVQAAARAGLEAVIVCPTGVIGPYDFRGSMMGAVIHGAARRRPTLYLDGAYDFVDVRDVVEGLLAAAERGARGQSYILSGQRIRMRDLLEAVRSITGRRFFRLPVPFWLARLAAHITPAYYRWRRIPPRITPYSIEVLRSNSNISHARAQRELGYRPRPLRESLADAVRWYLQPWNADLNPLAAD
jgi:dihydroflavonol-4-reductase